MTKILAPENLTAPQPDHTQLPANDGVPVRNSLEPWQSALLSETVEPAVRAKHPEGDYFIGQDCGIYWEKSDPPSKGCKAPDWYLVPGVPRLLDGQMRRSYVLWQELVAPLILLEYASDGGDEERDRTPTTGKFWVYERRIRPAYYGIYLPDEGSLEMYQLVADHFERMKANAEGRYVISYLNAQIGIWHGEYAGFEIPWLRWWDAQGNLLPTGEEAAAASKRENEKLANKLRELGIDPRQL
jgi:Uma2 family endonuclease